MMGSDDPDVYLFLRQAARNQEEYQDNLQHILFTEGWTPVMFLFGLGTTTGHPPSVQLIAILTFEEGPITGDYRRRFAYIMDTRTRKDVVIGSQLLQLLEHLDVDYLLCYPQGTRTPEGRTDLEANIQECFREIATISDGGVPFWSRTRTNEVNVILYNVKSGRKVHTWSYQELTLPNALI